MWVGLLAGYVDDGRQVTSLLKKGMRYHKEKKEFIWTEEAEKEDITKHGQRVQQQHHENSHA